MATENFTDLPVSTGANLTDIFAAVQSYSSPTILGTSVQQTLQQVFDLYQQHIVISTNGNPNGSVIGINRQFCWDIINKILYICTLAGTTTTTVWEKVIQLTAGTGISINQSGNTISISASSSSSGAIIVTTPSTNMTSNTSYIVSYVSGTASLVLPTTSIAGDIINIVGKSSGGFVINQNALQSIHIGTSLSTAGVGGSVASTHGTDSLKLMCVTDNLEWACLGAPQSSLLTII